MLNLDTSGTATKLEHMRTDSKINDINCELGNLSFEVNQQNKWALESNAEAKEPNDIEFLEYHYHRLIRKYDVPFENLKHVKDICLRYLDREKAEEERKRLAHQLEVYKSEVQRHSKVIILDEKWLAEGGEE